MAEDQSAGEHNLESKTRQKLLLSQNYSHNNGPTAVIITSFTHGSRALKVLRPLELSPTSLACESK
jgi:hypothetical protein